MKNLEAKMTLLQMMFIDFINISPPSKICLFYNSEPNHPNGFPETKTSKKNGKIALRMCKYLTEFSFPPSRVYARAPRVCLVFTFGSFGAN